MKIAILSMQEVKNYGSFLQAYSLKKNIESLGHSCDFINIIPGEQLGEYKISRFHKIRLLIERLFGWDFTKRFKNIYTFQKRFSNEFHPELGVKKGKNDNHYDVIVIGSDEVFNCSQTTWFGFSKQLFGEGLNADKVISYAGSFGATTIEELSKLEIKDVVTQLLSNFSAISIRDANSFNVIKELTGRSPHKHLDPVLIYNYDNLMPPHIKHHDYMIVYTYPGRINDINEIKAIKDYAKKNHLKLISIGHYFPWCDEIVVPHPFEVLAYFKKATCIVTDTFHGSIFSIKYNKVFCTIVRGMNNNKLSHLLAQFDLNSRIVNSPDKLESILNTPINYSRVNEIISLETQRSIEYLKVNLA